MMSVLCATVVVATAVVSTAEVEIEITGRVEVREAKVVICQPINDFGDTRDYRLYFATAAEEAAAIRQIRGQVATVTRNATATGISFVGANGFNAIRVKSYKLLELGK